MYDYVSGIIGAPSDPSNPVLWVSGLCLLVLVIGIVYCFSRLFR